MSRLLPKAEGTLIQSMLSGAAKAEDEQQQETLDLLLGQYRKDKAAFAEKLGMDEAKADDRIVGILTAAAESADKAIRNWAFTHGDLANLALPGLTYTAWAGTGFSGDVLGRGVSDKISYANGALPIRQQDISIRFEGYLVVPDDADYTFSLTSDDGSWLWIADKQVIDNGGFHGPIAKTATLPLKAGFFFWADSGSRSERKTGY